MSIYDDSIIMTYCIAVTAILGAVFGSFLNCAAMRIAKEESFIKGHSRCPKCNHNLGAMDLIPIFSWIFSGGKCRYCKEKVSIRYPLTEIVFAVLSVMCLLEYDLTIICVRNLILLGCLFCLSLVDLESYIIPDGCHIIAIGAWVVTGFFAFEEYGGWHGIALNILAAVLYGGGMLLMSLIMDRVLKKDSLGGGDIKLFIVVGLYLGLAASLFALLIACVLGIAFSLLFLKKDSDGNQKLIPFGPAIAASMWGMLMYGEPLVNWYLSLF